VVVAANFVNNDKFADIITGPGRRGGKLPVEVFSGKDNTVLDNVFAGKRFSSAGVRVASVDVNDNNEADILVGAGPGAPGTHVRAFDGLTSQRVDLVFAHLAAFPNGVFVAGR